MAQLLRGGAVYFDFFDNDASHNIHRPQTLTAYLEGLPVGTHTIEIWAVPHPMATVTVDCYFSYNDMRWTIEAEEVF